MRLLNNRAHSLKDILPSEVHAFFYKQRIFSTQVLIGFLMNWAPIVAYYI